MVREIKELENISEEDREQLDEETNDWEIEDAVRILEKACIFTDEEFRDLAENEGLTKRQIAQAMINQTINLGLVLRFVHFSVS